MMIVMYHLNIFEHIFEYDVEHILLIDDSLCWKISSFEGNWVSTIILS